MYGRRYAGRELNFEPSGGLLHASLVMQDKETSSYWAIMTGESLAGELQGTRLDELPVGEKTTWADWKARFPDTKVLSVDGAEHIENNPYDNYFASDAGFRGSTARDRRLATKEPIFAFFADGEARAIVLSQVEGGAVLRLGDRDLFLHRPTAAPVFHSTAAFVGEPGSFAERDGTWYHGDQAFDPKRGRFAGEVERLDGFDTFWFNFSETHPEVKILRPGASDRE